MSTNVDGELDPCSTCCTSSKDFETLKETIITEYRYLLVTEIHKTVKKPKQEEESGLLS